MVHTGRPSRGCGVCRKRRIKCDEKSPGCSYCIKTKQKCPGYKDQFDLVWRDQTNAAQKNVERRKRATAMRDEQLLPNLYLKPASGSFKEPINVEHITMNVPVGLSETPETYAVSFFFEAYANPRGIPEERKGFLEYVAPQYVKTKPNSTLKMATMAVSSFMSGAWLDRRPDTVLSRSFYIKAVSAMRDQICQRQSCANNDVLTSVLLMQMYEVLVGIKKKSKCPRAHLDGALALIKYRGAENFRDDIDQSLLFHVRSQLIDESFNTGQHLTDDVSTWTEHLTEASMPASARLDNINVDLANLAASATQRAELPPALKSKLNPEDILRKAKDIEYRLTKWTNTLPFSWLPILVVGDECIPPKIKTAGLYQEHCHIYPSINVAASWNSQRISCIRVQSIIYDSLLQQPPTPENLRSRIDSENKIQQMADDVCASIPFFLGDKTKPGSLGDKSVQYPHTPGWEVPHVHYQQAPAMAGFWLLGPLQTLWGLRISLRGGQKEWVSGQMARIAYIYRF